MRKDVDKIMAHVQGAGERVLRPRRTNWAAWLAVLTAGTGAVAAALIYKPSRGRIKRTFGMSDGSAWIDTGSDGSSDKAHAEDHMAA